MPLGLIKDFQDDLKQIRQDKEKQKNHDWSKKLVGHVNSEYLISPEIMQKWKQKFFDPIIIFLFINLRLELLQKLLNILFHQQLKETN